MNTLLLVEDTEVGRREYFELDGEFEALELLKEWCLENHTHEVFLTEVGPGIDRRIDSGHELFTSDFKIREPGSRDIWCVSCGTVREAMTEAEIGELPVRKWVDEKDYCIETQWITSCTNCISYMVVEVHIAPKKRCASDLKNPPNTKRRKTSTE